MIRLEIGRNIYVLVANEFAGFKIIELNNPLNPVLVSSIDIGGYALGVSTM